MTRKQVYLFVVLVMISLVAAMRQGLLKSVYSNEARDRELAELVEKRWQYQRLRNVWEGMRDRLQRANQKLTGDSLAYLPDVGDPYAWASRQVSFLAGVAGVRIETIQAERAPALRERRGQEPRLFVPYRCRVDLAGELPGLVKLIEEAEARNPYLVVSEVYLGAVRPDDGLRTGHVMFDWPMWADPALAGELVSAFNALNAMEEAPGAGR